MTTLVCGVGGITGDAVLSVLARRAFGVRALVHREKRRSAAVRLGAESVVVADYDDEPSLAAAVEGVDAIFFVAASYQEGEPSWVAAMLRAAQAAGVERFVYQSVLHPFTPSMPHHARKAQAEIAVRASGLRWTILQPAMYAQTVLRMRMRSPDGLLNVPYSSDARFTVIDVRDLAACVATVLADGGHVYGGYEIVGTEAQSMREMAATMNGILGEDRQVRQVDPGSLALPPGWGPSQREEYAAMCREYDANGLLGSNRTAAALLGRTPTTFAAVVVRDVRDGPIA